MTDEKVELYCPDCGYSLRGLPGPRCPECGLDLTGSTVSPIPWEHRREIGRWKAFWRTLLLATFRPTRVTRAVGSPVDGASAVQFRWIAMGMAAIGLVGLYLAYMAHAGESTTIFNLVDERETVQQLNGPGVGARWELSVLWSAGTTLPAVVPLGIVVMFLVPASSPIVRIGRRGDDDTRFERARAVGNYAWAPLAWIPVCALAWGAGWAWGESEFRVYLREAWILFMTIVWGWIAVVIMATFWSPAQVVRRGTQCGVVGAVCAAIDLPVELFVGAAVGLGVLPCVVGLARIAIDSLR